MPLILKVENTMLSKSLLKKLSRKLNLTVISRDRFVELKTEASKGLFWEFLQTYPNTIGRKILTNLEHSRSQLRQDLFALAESDFKKGGFFVEFGATNGIDLSNTYLMETKFAWRGILAEPGRNWTTAIKKNRNSKIETKCVWSKSGDMLEFMECDSPELSTLASLKASDGHKVTRVPKANYSVETISLLDLLKKHKAPNTIEYLSIDTEGSEFEILNAFDFGAYDIKCITCEHNHTPQRLKIYELLTRNGYRRKFEALSKFDDWYVKT